MQPRQQEDRLPIEDIEAKLIGNDPEFKMFELRTLVVNPGLDPEDNYFVSRVKDADLKRLARALRQNTTLTFLAINGDDSSRYKLEWTSAGAEAIGKALKKHPSLKRLVIRLNASNEQVSGFLNALTGSARITSLTLEVKEDPLSQLNQLGRVLLKNDCLERIFVRSVMGDLTFREEKVSLSDLALGLAHQKKLRTLCFNRLPLGNAGVSEIVRVSQMTSLEIMGFVHCGILGTARDICSLVKKNPALEELDLSDNPLGGRGISDIVSVLPALTHLKVLSLGHTNLDHTALSLLSGMYEKNKVSVAELTLSDENFAKKVDPSLKLTTQLIRSPVLKKLCLYRSGIWNAQLQKLAPALKDSHLEEFKFYDGREIVNSKTHNILLDVMYQNEYLCFLNLFSDEFEVARDINNRKKILREWNDFVVVALSFFSANHSESKKESVISRMSADAVGLLLLFLAPNTPRTTKKSVFLCINLVRANAEKRIMLMSEGKYHPKKNLLEGDKQGNRKIIQSTWWSKEEEVHSVRLFLSKEVIWPSCMKLPDIISMINPYLEIAESERDVNDLTKENIIIDFSPLSPGQQRYVRDVFSRFLEICHKHRNMPLGVAAIQNKTRKLIIAGVTLAALREAAHLVLPPPVVEQRVKRQCVVM